MEWLKNKMEAIIISIITSAFTLIIAMYQNNQQIKNLQYQFENSIKMKTLDHRFEYEKLLEEKRDKYNFELENSLQNIAKCFGDIRTALYINNFESLEGALNNFAKENAKIMMKSDHIVVQQVLLKRSNDIRQIAYEFLKAQNDNNKRVYYNTLLIDKMDAYQLYLPKLKMK